MENGLITRWFLGANSGAGFYSLYDNFASGDGDFLWVIKGGPGCGKSAFMKKIGIAAEEKGLNVEYIRCSGDPASLDGIYLPSLKTGWVDGTAPHTLDPVHFGATGAYLDLGVFCDVESAHKIRGDVAAISARYKGLYARAYDCLRAAAAVAPEKHPDLLKGTEKAAAVKRASAAAARELPKMKKNAEPGSTTMRLISGITCDGTVFLKDTLTTLCKRIYVLDNRYGLAEPYLREWLRLTRERGLDTILCPSPLNPSVLEALIIPSLSLGFLATSGDTDPGFKPYRHVRLDALTDPERVRRLRPRLRADMKIKSALLDAAIESLREAKDLHDALEAHYNPLIDFDGVRAAADKEIARLMAGAGQP
ncbi:MAG TPA: hypothetical protein DD735_00040 [Clostridiales bacterium]|nr:hypothetical protein [Clostridiales bacterium]